MKRTPLRANPDRPLRRVAGITRRGGIHTKHRDTGPTRTVADAVRDRWEGRCARCGKPGHTKQHRIPRQIGGSRHDPRINRLSNLVLVCGDGVTLCHGEIERQRVQARADGYLLYRRQDPTKVPVLLWDGRRVLLDNLGDWTEVETAS